MYSETSQCNYDKTGDNHYDTISAFIKSMRGSDPDAAVYYLAKMLYAGEDIKFIARRIMICAAEDVGNADPMALTVAVSAAQAVERIGMPEAQIILSQAVIYVATAPKSNSAVNAIFEAMDNVKKDEDHSACHISRTPITAVRQIWDGASVINTHMIIRIIMWNSNIFRMRSRMRNFTIQVITDMRKISKNG